MIAEALLSGKHTIISNASNSIIPTIFTLIEVILEITILNTLEDKLSSTEGSIYLGKNSY